MNPNERRRLILDRSGEVFAAKGVSATTIRELGTASGVQSGALYHYFESKEAIVVELFREYLTDLAERCRRVVAQDLAPLPRLRALTLTALEIGRTHPAATTIWQREWQPMRAQVEKAGLAPLADSMITAWRDAVADGVASGDLRHDIDVEAFRELLQDAVWHTSRWAAPGAERSSAALADTIMAIFVDGMRPR